MTDLRYLQIDYAAPPVEGDHAVYDGSSGLWVPQRTPGFLQGLDSTNSGDAYSISVNARYTAYGDGDGFLWRPNAVNAGNPTLNVTGLTAAGVAGSPLGAKTIKKFGGLVNVPRQDLYVGQTTMVEYDSGQDCMLLIAPHSPLLHRSTSVGAVVSTVDETDIYSGGSIVPANLMSTARKIRMCSILDCSNSKGSAGNFRLRVYFGPNAGPVEIFDSQNVNINNGVTYAIGIETVITNEFATGFQDTKTVMHYADTSDGEADNNAPLFGGETGPAAADTTAACSLSITGDLDASSASFFVRCKSVTVELW